MDGERMAQRMRRNRLGNATAPMGRPAGAVHRAGGDRLPGAIAGKEPGAGATHPPPVAQHLEQRRGEHDVAILLPLALLDAEDHALSVDRRRGQAHGFGDAKAGGIAGREDRAMLERRHAVKELGDFAGAEHHGQRVRRLGRRDHGVDRPRLLEGDGVEEAEGGHGDHQGRRRQLLLSGQIDLVGPNLLGAQRGGRPAEVAGEARDVLDVGTLRRRGEVANPHVLEHALPKRGHRGLLLRTRLADSRRSSGAYVRMRGIEAVGASGCADRSSDARSTVYREAV